MIPDASTLLASAVVSAAVASLFGFTSQALERRARRRELIFAKSVELAKANRDFLVMAAEKMRVPARISDFVVYAEMYHWLLAELHDKGKLPEKWQAEIKVKFPDL